MVKVGYAKEEGPSGWPLRPTILRFYDFTKNATSVVGNPDIIQTLFTH
jgi:hypothetical protein